MCEYSQKLENEFACIMPCLPDMFFGYLLGSSNNGVVWSIGGRTFGARQYNQYMYVCAYVWLLDCLSISVSCCCRCLLAPAKWMRMMLVGSKWGGAWFCFSLFFCSGGPCLGTCLLALLLFCCCFSICMDGWWRNSYTWRYHYLFRDGWRIVCIWRGYERIPIKFMWRECYCILYERFSKGKQVA